MKMETEITIDRPEWSEEKTILIKATLSGRGDEFSIDDLTAELDGKPLDLTGEEADKAEEKVWDIINDPYANDYNP